jgi:hypothetical protein
VQIPPPQQNSKRSAAKGGSFAILLRGVTVPKHCYVGICKILRGARSVERVAKSGRKISHRDGDGKFLGNPAPTLIRSLTLTEQKRQVNLHGSICREMRIVSIIETLGIFYAAVVLTLAERIKWVE